MAPLYLPLPHPVRGLLPPKPGARVDVEQALRFPPFRFTLSATIGGPGLVSAGAGYQTQPGTNLTIGISTMWDQSPCGRRVRLVGEVWWEPLRRRGERA